MSRFTTFFAPAERAAQSVVLRQREALEQSKTTRLVDAVPQIIMVLNAQRQLVYCNLALLQMLNLDSMDAILGKRPGEILSCIHASRLPGGCGTSEFCTKCGAVQAIISSLNGHRDIQECHLLRSVNGRIEALDLSVSATPFPLDSESFTIFCVTDVSHEKRRRALERTFFHDILNHAGGLRGLLGLLAEDAPETMREELNLAHTQFKYLVEEIISQKDIMAAESDELTPHFIQLNGDDVIKVMASTYSSHEAAAGKLIRAEPAEGDLSLHTDYNLLCRILGNMLKNALEATSPGEIVSISCRADQDAVVFSVRNPGVMPPDVQLQVFKRSFSTKGKDRGLGTFSMKLFAERYLGGEVSFTSHPDTGTIFMVRLPRHAACDLATT
ncbi:MAG: ATP-binding protein [Desulfocurvibacter africanus]